MMFRELANRIMATMAIAMTITMGSTFFMGISLELNWLSIAI